MLAEPLAPSPIEGLSELFSIYERYSDRIPLDVLASSLERLDLTREDLSGFSIFKADCYCRNRLTLGASYEALLICWRPGQESPIHDHAGSSCAFRVLQGDCSETLYEPSLGELGQSPARVGLTSTARTPGITPRGESMSGESTSPPAPGQVTSSMVVPVRTRTEVEGFVCAAQDADIHRVANLGAKNLQTLHVYSPPLRKMGTYKVCGEQARA